MKMQNSFKISGTHGYGNDQPTATVERIVERNFTDFDFSQMDSEQIQETIWQKLEAEMDETEFQQACDSVTVDLR